jgi:GxxExxY protein
VQALIAENPQRFCRIQTGVSGAVTVAMVTLTPEIEAIVTRIIGCAIAVHEAFGPGLLESVYHHCMQKELTAAGLSYKTEWRVPLFHRGQKVCSDLKLDLLVEDAVVVEIKSVDRIHPVHLAQVITYLKLANRPVGLLFNFNTTRLRNGGIRRVTHPDLYGQTKVFME